MREPSQLCHIAFPCKPNCIHDFRLYINKKLVPSVSRPSFLYSKTGSENSRFTAFSLLAGVEESRTSFLEGLSSALILFKTMIKLLLGPGGTELKSWLGLFAFFLLLFLLFSSCRFCTLDADWFAARLLSAASHVRPVNRNKCRRAIWNAHMVYERIRLMSCFYHFIGNFTPKNFWFRHAFVVSSV